MGSWFIIYYSGDNYKRKLTANLKTRCKHVNDAKFKTQTQKLTEKCCKQRIKFTQILSKWKCSTLILVLKLVFKVFCIS